jgi:hypothetical protein
MDDSVKISLKKITDNVHEFVMPTIKCNNGVAELVEVMQRIKLFAQISEDYQVFVSNVNNYFNLQENTLIVQQIKKHVNEVFNR